jgi:hypothetical protein
MLAAISLVASSVMIVTFSLGWIRRQTFTAFRAPGVSSGSNESWLSCRWD